MNPKRVLAERGRPSPLVNAWGRILEYFPTVLFLWFLRLHTKGITIRADLVLQTRNDTNRQLFLFAAKAVGGANHLGALHGLSMPMVAVETTFQMGVTFSLEQIVVVAFLGQVVHVVVLTVVADLFDHGPNSCFILADQFSVLNLLLLQDFDEALLLREGTFKFGNASS